MGIFYEQVEVVNRTSKTIEVVYDGQRIKLKPNYTEDGERVAGVVNMVPKLVIPYALNQNVLMGSEDPMDPSEFQSVIGVVDPTGKNKHSWNDCSFIEQDPEKLTRVPLEDYLEDPSAKILVRGKVAPRAGDAALGARSVFDRKA